jgi:hypothetical protein
MTWCQPSKQSNNQPTISPTNLPTNEAMHGAGDGWRLVVGKAGTLRLSFTPDGQAQHQLGYPIAQQGH